MTISSKTNPLIGVLRCELTAVHQQFVHILALRKWGLTDTATRILEVDRVDFPVAMQIIDHLVATGQPLALPPSQFSPGSNELEVLAAELSLEKRLLAALVSNDDWGQRGAELIARAMVPRQAYSRWLSERVRPVRCEDRQCSSDADDVADLFACLVAMIEQTMIHAFVHWHHGAKENADGAWASSGAAMMQATEIVNRLAGVEAAPTLGAAVPSTISYDPDLALSHDMALAAVCFERASVAAKNPDNKLHDLCEAIADYAMQLSDWLSGREHPALRTNPPAFSSFEATLHRFVVG